MILVQIVRLPRGGEPVRMGKRAGEFVTLREVVEEVGADATRFFFLMRKADSQLEFDLELAKKQSTRQPGLLRAVRARAHLQPVQQGGGRGPRSPAVPRRRSSTL